MKMKSNAGYTLVELIVTFALISIFAAMVVAILPNTIRLYTRMENMSNAVLVTNTLLDKCSGALQEASPQGNVNVTKTKVTYVDENGAGKALTLTTYSEYETYKAQAKVSTSEATGVKHSHSGSGDIICVHHDRIPAANYFDDSDVLFDEEVYHGYKVSDVTFELPAGFPKNVIKITLQIQNDKNFTYQASRYVKLYNFAENSTKIN
ncbi:MAG: type II secretion system protein [Erysipelotrichaceae bacterium]|nr:type II secretion system protein [Erysipelotrichaceae bacterium]